MNREMMATIMTCGMWCGVASAAVDASLAARLNAMVSTDRLRITHMELASEPHVAGTPGDERTIGRLMNLFEEAGLETTRHDIWPLLARPVRAEVSIVSPTPRSLAVQENAVDGDVDSRTSDVGWNAYSGSGVAEGPVVYVNYGTKQDFERLASMGVSCEGKIVLARYGGNYRGYKVKFAQQAGAIGLIIFTDPADGGHVSGPVYPIGGYANECHIQRGSVVTMPFQGDPLTPGREATEDAVRDRVEDAPLPRIPSQPIGYGAAKEILAAMRGVAAPKEWQGGLGFEYRLESDGGGEAGVRVRVEVKQERAVMRTANVIGEIRGTEFPDERVIIGAHHDAWNHGASDPLSGTIAVIEAARVFGALAMEGIKPRRTLVFAAWGAEEFGIIGSSEWVEGNERMLVEGGVAYINLDMASMGPKFGASATPSMHGVILAAAGLVPQAGAAESTVLEDWTGRTAPRPGLGRRPAIGNIGGGSDHVAFIARAGVACAAFGSGGSAGQSYHSAFDTLPWYWKVVGADYEPAAMVTKMAAMTAAAYAFEAEQPTTPGEYARVGMETLVAATKAATEAGLDASRLEPLKVAMAELAFAVRDAGTGMNVAGVMAMDRAWLLPEGGLERRPWFRNAFASPDENSGYGAWVFPLLQAAIERKDAAEWERACVRTLERIEAAKVAARSREGTRPSPAVLQGTGRGR
jgi:N-acetylated-alpha-linked acidic dipeptidase